MATGLLLDCCCRTVFALYQSSRGWANEAGHKSVPIGTSNVLDVRATCMDGRDTSASGGVVARAFGFASGAAKARATVRGLYIGDGRRSGSLTPVCKRHERVRSRKGIRDAKSADDRAGRKSRSLGCARDDNGKKRARRSAAATLATAGEADPSPPFANGSSGFGPVRAVGTRK